MLSVLQEVVFELARDQVAHRVVQEVVDDVVVEEGVLRALVGPVELGVGLGQEPEEVQHEYVEEGAVGVVVLGVVGHHDDFAFVLGEELRDAAAEALPVKHEGRWQRGPGHSELLEVR